MKKYAFKDLVVTLNAPPAVVAHQCSHWGTGDAIKVMRREDAMTDKVGADGKMQVAVNANRSGEITLKFLQTSPSNKVLNALHSLQEAKGSFVPVQVAIQDLSRLDTFAALAGYIKKLPEITRGAEGSEQEWTIVVEDLSVLLGNPLFAGLPTQLAENVI